LRCQIVIIFASEGEKNFPVREVDEKKPDHKNTRHPQEKNKQRRQGFLETVFFLKKNKSGCSQDERRKDKEKGALDGESDKGGHACKEYLDFVFTLSPGEKPDGKDDEKNHLHCPNSDPAEHGERKIHPDKEHSYHSKNSRHMPFQGEKEEKKKKAAEKDGHDVHLGDARSKNKKHGIIHVMRKRADMHHVPLVHLPSVEHDLVPGIESISSGITVISHADTQALWRISARMDNPQTENEGKEQQEKNDVFSSVHHLLIPYSI
jgi:hypothetical protein